MDRYDDLVGMQSIYDTSDTEEYVEISEPARSVDVSDNVNSHLQEQRMFSEIIDEPEMLLDWACEDEVSDYVQGVEEDSERI